MNRTLRPSPILGVSEQRHYQGCVGHRLIPEYRSSLMTIISDDVSPANSGYKGVMLARMVTDRNTSWTVVVYNNVHRGVRTKKWSATRCAVSCQRTPTEKSTRHDVFYMEKQRWSDEEPARRTQTHDRMPARNARRPARPLFDWRRRQRGTRPLEVRSASPPWVSCQRRRDTTSLQFQKYIVTSMHQHFELHQSYNNN